MSAARRHRALLIGNWTYDDRDGRLVGLDGPKHDVAVLREALTDPDFGLFDDDRVQVVTNCTSGEMAAEVYRFIKQAERDDDLLLYFSGHGERVAGGRLGLCGTDVQYSDFIATCFNSHSIREWLDEFGRARSTVIVFDCCFAGQFKSADVVETELLFRSLGEGTAVLSSSGNEPSRDSSVPGQPSPFTGALSRILCDPTLVGSDGALTVDHVFDALVSERLPTRPVKNIRDTGDLALARRRPIESTTETRSLRGWSEHVTFRTVEIAVRDGRIEAEVEGEHFPREFTEFDDTRRNAVRRLSQLADAVVQTSGYNGDTARQRAARRALECAGQNLFEAALPEAVRDRIATMLVGGDHRVLRLRLVFDEESCGLEQYPWEFLARGSGRDDPLGLRSEILVQRVRTSSLPVPDLPAADGPSRIGIVNGLAPPFDRAGFRLAEELKPLASAELVFQDVGVRATWNNLIDHCEDDEPHYLVLYLPVARLDRNEVRIGFSWGSGEPDWRSPGELARVLRGGTRGVAVVSVASPPGQDCFRATTQFVHALAGYTSAPIFFVCHQPGFEEFINDLPAGRPATFWGLLLDALTHGKDVERSFWYARDKVLRRISDRLRPFFGVPGLYWRGHEPGPTTAPRRAAAGTRGRVADPPSPGLHWTTS
ncbi:caspase family protein [Actinomycetospora lutea]|uniref:caspase family protein n=1 Tax=Actinomycetospora lutea TaxID=663604 RepID=UPI00236720FD|nr:caspase family protein [Actinomycetospora lutea]MDD7937551.1 caspase family protein [Actinomycetospora lutea]